MDVVLEFQPGRAIPQISMEISHNRLGEGQPVHQRVEVELTGVHEPTSFRLKCTHEAPDRGKPCYYGRY